MKLKIKDFFTKDAKLSFLVGAGCSIDAPSCLPAGIQMMEEIIRFSCPKDEQKRILNISELRFEQLVEIIQNRDNPFFEQAWLG